MDGHQQQSHYQPNFETPQNLSFKSQNNSLHDKQLKTSFGNENYENLSEFSIYCMSDASGRLHFSLSIFQESTLNPLEQQNLGRQLPEYIRDHYDKYRRLLDSTQTGSFSLEGADHFGPHLQALYDDFRTRNPAFSLSFQTYIKALGHLSSSRLKPFSRPSSAHSVQNSFPNYRFTGQEKLTIPSYHPDLSHNNSSAYNVALSSSDRISTMDKTEWHDRGNQEKKYNEREEAMFFNQLNICRRKENLQSVDGNYSKIHAPKHHPSSYQSNVPQSCSSSNEFREEFIQNFHPSPLPPRCSCPSKKCLTLFSENERQQICKRFWYGKTRKRKNLKWMGASVQGNFSYGSRSQFERKSCFFFIGKYFLHKPASGRLKVCRHFFLTTLGLYFSFPLFDILRRKSRKDIHQKHRSSSDFHSRKRKTKKRTSVKHHMKRHVRSYFYRHYFHRRIAPSSVEPRARMSFMHFSLQFPHLLNNKSFEKYLSIIHKFANSRKQQHLDSSIPSFNSISWSRKSGSTSQLQPDPPETKHLVNPASSVGNNTDNSKIMKIKAEDIDEVIAYDFAKKSKGETGNVSEEDDSYYNEGKQSNSLDLMDSTASAMPTNMEGNSSGKSPPSNDKGTNMLISQLYPETLVGGKRTRGLHTKVKRNAKQKKKKKSDNVRKKSSKKDNLSISSVPKKTYKLAVNEIEGDQSKHPILPPCNCIKSKCASKVPEEQRKAIHSTFWNLDNISRRGWMVKHVHILKPKSRSNRATARLHQMHRKFFLPDANGELHDVCKKFFLGTLGFRGTGVLRPQSVPGFKNSSPEKEPRKRILSYQVCQQDVVSVIEYCQSFNKEKDVGFCGDEKFTHSLNYISDNPQQKIFVPYGFTWKELYRDYCFKNPHIEFGYQTFRSILSIVEHNNFSVDVLEKFQNSEISSDLAENSTNDFQENTDSEISAPSLQEQYHLLQSFPSVPKIMKKTLVEKDPAKDVKEESERPITKPERPITKPRKKLKLSKSFFTSDFNETIKCYKPRNTCNTRYNFREGVPLVSYSFNMDLDVDFQNDEVYNNDYEEDDIKEEASSDQEKSKKPVRSTGKRLGRPPKKQKKKYKSASGDVVSDIKGKSFTTMKKRGRKSTWKLKIDMRQRESTIRLKSRHPILPPCKCNYRKCHEKVTEEQRKNIHDLYWSISSKQERIRWVLEHIRRCSPKSRSNTNLPSRKRETRRYFLPGEGSETIEVCRVFFLRTLGYHWDSVVDSVSRTLPRPGGYLAKSLGFSEEQLPYEVIVQLKTFLKRKKIRKSSISADQFPDESQTGENDNNREEEDFILEGYAMKELFNEFLDMHPEHTLDFRGFKQIVRFILVPGSEAQTEWEIKQEQLQNANSENSGFGNEGQKQAPAIPDNTVYFTPEFEKEDLEKALVRKARRRRPLSARNSKDQHPMREPCKCARKCREKIDQRKREEIHEQYWSLITYNQRKQWILEHIKREAPKRRTNPNGPIKKMETRKFYFVDWSGNKVEICKGFFLSTLGFKWDKMVDTICKTTPRDGQFVRPDQRGKKPPSHKLSETLISSVTNYIETIFQTASCVYPKTPSKPHTGKQKKTPERMPYGLTMKNLFEDYKVKHPNHKVGYESFRKIYRSVIHSEKCQPPVPSPSQDQDDDYETEVNHLSQPHQPMANMPMLVSGVDSSSVEGANEHEVPNFDSVQQSCMYKNQTAMRLHTPEQAHLPSYQRHCEPSILKPPFSDSINSFPKSHDIQFYPQTLEQNEEMSMQMYKSICLPPSNPNQPYPFYPNSLPLDAFSMSSTSQGIHSGLPYSESLRHSDLMHHHPYQPPHPHFNQARFHGFVLPGSTSKEPEPSHHQHAEINVCHNYRDEFNCNSYPSKNPLVYPPAYHNTDNMPSSSCQRHSFNNLPAQTHGIHEVRSRDTSSTPTTTSLLEKGYVIDSSSNNCHAPTSIPTDSSQTPSSNEWPPHLVSLPNKMPPLETDPSKRNVKRSKGRPSKKPPKEKIPKVKKAKKVRPKSKRNTREFNPMLPPCKCTVKKCLEKIPEPRRKEIYDFFWDLGCYNTRKQWIAENIVREDPKRRTSLDNPLRRMETRRFFLPNSEDEKMEVCKGFFLRTLGFKWDKMVDTICKTTEKGQAVVRPDMRGKRGPSHKLKEEVASSVESYVRSILQAAKPAYEAHVEQSEVREDDKDVFVPYGLTMKNFHEDYKGKHAHHKVGYESFRKIFRRVSREVLENVSLQEDTKGDLTPTSSKEGSDVISPITGLPQQTLSS